jgi:hypothetical protein
MHNAETRCSLRNFNGALSKKYLDVDKILKKAMMGTDIHEERLVLVTELIARAQSSSFRRIEESWS